MARYAKFFSVGGGGGGTNNLQLPIGTVLDATLRQVQDGTGTGSPLYLSINRVGITSDPTVTTQTSSVIQATTTNANLVIAPNGTGAIVASIPDGTATGGNARGANAVDLQTSRTLNTQIAGRDYSVIAGGQNNLVGGVASAKWSGILAGRGNSVLGNFDGIISGDANTTNLSGSYNVIGGGLSNAVSGSAAYSGVFSGASNTASANYSVVSGGLTNTASSTWCTVSGGQSNTASTNTHATVVGGQSNTSSGQKSVVGGNNNVGSGNWATTFGNGNTASGQQSLAIGSGCTASATGAIALGYSNNTNLLGIYGISLGAESQSYLRGQQSLGCEKFTTIGDAQQSLLTARKSDTLTTGATTILSLDGTGTTSLIIPNGNNRLWAVKVVATAFVSVAGGTLVLGDSYMGEFTMLFKRVGGTSSVVGVNSANLIYDTNMATAAFTFAAGASQDLQITFKAPTTASATTFRCVAKVELVEVAY